MSLPVADRSAWPFVAAGLAAIVAAGIGIGVVGGIFSPTVWIDVIALWPVAVAGWLVGAGVWLGRGRQRRDLAIWGLSAFTWLALGLALHLTASPWLPVSESVIDGPDASGFESARMEIEIEDGDVAVSAGAPTTYQVSPMRTAGSLAAPAGYEQQRAGELSVVVVPLPNPGIFVFGGWRVGLNEALSWSLTLAAPNLEVEVATLSIDKMTLTAESSRVSIGPALDGSELVLIGNHTLFIPSEVGARIEGEAIVPDGWEPSDGGFSSSAGAEGWVIRVEPGSDVRVVSG